MNKFKKSKKKYRKSKKQMGGNKCGILVEHPLSHFIEKKINNYYFLKIDSNNHHKINFKNIYFKTFTEKMLKILQYSFNREREYHIKKGLYNPNYKHNVESILTNLKSKNYITFILTDQELEPVSFLYIELKNNDYDKMWTVCTDKEQRGNGLSTILVNNCLKCQKKRKNDILLEIFDDEEIERINDEPRQSHIKKLFSNCGFKEKHRSELDSNTINNLLMSNNGSKVMIYKY